MTTTALDWRGKSETERINSEIGEEEKEENNDEETEEDDENSAEDDDEGIVKIDTIRKPGSRSSLRKEGSSHTRRLTLSNRFNSI